MKRATLLLLIPIALLLLFAAAIFLLDFRLQQAEMGVESSFSTYAFGQDGEGTAPPAQALDLYVRAPAMLEGELIEALQEELIANPHVGQINLRETPPAPGADSVFVLTMEGPQSYFWTPVYARSALTVDVAYASDGEVAWIGEQVVTIEADEKPAARVVRTRGEYTFDSTAYGLLSRPAYRRYLAEEIAHTVIDALASTLADQRGALS